MFFFAILSKNLFARCGRTKFRTFAPPHVQNVRAGLTICFFCDFEQKSACKVRTCEISHVRTSARAKCACGCGWKWLRVLRLVLHSTLEACTCVFTQYPYSYRVLCSK